MLVGIAACVGSEAAAQLPERGLDRLQLRARGVGQVGPLTLLTARAERESGRLLCQASARVRSAVPMSDQDGKRSELLAAEQLADSALALLPTVEALYWRTAARGMRADIESGGDQIDLASAVHEEALAILSLEPGHAGAHHVLGRLHGAVMRLGRIKRFMATRVLGGGALSNASWESAEHHFRKALAHEPQNVEHKLELANVLIDTGREEEARPLLQEVASVDPVDAVVAFFRESARARLAELRDAP